jgi:hypothetical protein
MCSHTLIHTEWLYCLNSKYSGVSDFLGFHIRKVTFSNSNISWIAGNTGQSSWFLQMFIAQYIMYTAGQGRSPVRSKGACAAMRHLSSLDSQQVSHTETRWSGWASEFKAASVPQGDWGGSVHFDKIQAQVAQGACVGHCLLGKPWRVEPNPDVFRSTTCSCCTCPFSLGPT